MFLLPQIFIIDYGFGAKSSGFELGIGADLRFASSNAQFSLSSLNEGLIPMSGGLSFLEYQVGSSFTRKWNLLPIIPSSDLENFRLHLPVLQNKIRY